MANFKVFQNDADQLRTKIFGSNDVAVNTDSSGNLGITSTGLAITPPSDGLNITSTGLSITPPSDGLSITSSGLAITPPSDGLSITSSGLAITPPSDGLSITSSGLAITPPSDGILITSSGLAVAAGTTDVLETVANITDTAGTAATNFEVLGVKTFTFGIVNESTAANAQALVELQISPDGTNFITDDGPVTIDQNALDTLVPTVFLKYARVYYSAVNAASAVTLNIFFQGQLV